MMLFEYFFIGLVVGFIFYEITGITAGGVVAPAYFALFVKEPNKIFVTLLIALLVWGVLKWLSSQLIIYGRRRLMLAMLIGFCIKMGIELWIQPNPFFTFNLQSIGYIIPGLIANEMERQGVIQTVSAVGIVTILIYLVFILVR